MLSLYLDRSVPGRGCTFPSWQRWGWSCGSRKLTFPNGTATSSPLHWIHKQRFHRPNPHWIRKAKDQIRAVLRAEQVWSFTTILHWFSFDPRWTTKCKLDMQNVNRRLKKSYLWTSYKCCYYGLVGWEGRRRMILGEKEEGGCFWPNWAGPVCWYQQFWLVHK